MNNLEKFEEIVKILDKDTLTPKQLEDIVSALIKAVKKSNADSLALSTDVGLALQKTLTYLDKEHKRLLLTVEGKTDDVVADTKRMTQEVLAKATEALNEIKSIVVKDGKDADEDVIVNKIVNKLELPKYEEYKLEGKEVVNEINKLPVTEENQIDASHIKNLPETIKNVGIRGVLEAPKDGKTYGRKDRDWVEITPGGVDNFLDLTDVPDSYVGQGGKVVAVKADVSGLEFIAQTSTDEKVKYDVNDPTAGYIADKIIAGVGISVAEGVGADENKLVVTNSNPTPYTLPTAAAGTLGGIKVGTRLSIDGNGVLSADAQSGSGDVTGPASAVGDNFASFNLATGKIIKDSGSKASDFAPALGADDNYVTDAEKTAIGTISGKVTANGAITGATKTKITYDAKGLVTGGADATTADIADSSNKRYVTDAQSTVLGNTSGTNSGDNATNSQYSGLASSKQDTLTFGIAQNNAVKVSAADVASGEYARFTTTGLESRTGAEVLSDIGAQPAGSYLVAADITGKLDKSTYDAYSILMATTDNTPVAITIAEQTVIGRKTGGAITALTGLEALAILRPIGAGTFASGSTTYVMTDATVTANSIVDVYAQTAPVGAWSVDSAAGSFTITSTKTETGNVAFKYFINNV